MYSRRGAGALPCGCLSCRAGLPAQSQSLCSLSVCDTFLPAMQGGFASEVGQQSLVSALSSSMLAVRQLVVLLEHCGKVQAAASEQQQQQGQVRLLMPLSHMGMMCVCQPGLCWGSQEEQQPPCCMWRPHSSPLCLRKLVWIPLSAGRLTVWAVLL